jgi:signal transduction histidine kinase
LTTILVLDGAAASRHFLTTLLEYHGFRLLEAAGGVEALQIARSQHPDLIIADVLMPAMDGFEFVRQLREDESCREMRVIFYTAAYDQGDAQALAESCGVTRVLVKPSAPELILDTVRSVLGLAAFPDTLSERVTEPEAADASLLTSERRTFFESNPLPMWIMDQDSLAFLAVNEAAVRNYGYSRKEFLSMSLAGVQSPEEATSHRTKDGTTLDVVIFSQLATFEGRQVRVVLAEDITERRRNERKLRESEQQLRELVCRLQSVWEEERTRVARQLHDELGQAVTALKMNCSWITGQLADAPKVVIEKIKSSMALVDETIVTIRRLSTELRPGVLDFGLAAGIEWQAGEFQSISKIACTVELFGEKERLDTKRATQVFRIFQETLTNIARHSGATKVNILLCQEPDEVVLEVRDNGRGATREEVENRKSLGVLGMRERVVFLSGMFSIEGIPNRGTIVRVRVPV